MDSPLVMMPPVFTPPVIVPPKKKHGVRRIFLTLVLLIVIAAGVFTYIYRDQVFKSAWARSINVVEASFNSNGAVFQKEFTVFKTDFFKPINASSSAAVRVELTAKVTALEPLLANVSADVQKGLDQVSADTALSSKDATARDLFRACFEGRQKADEFIALGLTNTSKYMKANDVLLNYWGTDELKFQESFSKLGATMKAKNIKTMEADIATARIDVLKAKADTESAAALLGYDSFKKMAEAYGLFLSGLDDLEASIPNKDAALVYKAGDKWQEGVNAFLANKPLLITDLGRWFNEEMTEKYKSGNAELAKVNDVCGKAEAATTFEEEQQFNAKFKFWQ
jgi:hypothetical protein